MKKLAVIALVLAGLLVAANPADARGRWRARRHQQCCDDCCNTCCYTPCCEYVDKVVTCYRPVWHEKEVECVYNRLVPREVVTKHTCTVLVPEWKEEKRVCTVYTSQPREIEREVVCCKWVPTQVTDCCGCPY